ncbi:MAG: pGP6-D family virulence protein [Proteobacteria bacterium]|nr:pGP6-D family virulence protein [Pseudomonadota bacterium]
MSKANLLAKKFLALRKKEAPKAPETKEKNVVPHNSFRAMFDPHELAETEIDNLKMIFEESAVESTHEEEIDKDFSQLLQITSELKAIQKQAVILVGERICAVRDIFKRHGGEGIGFTAWLSIAFNAKKTAYNAMAYFELYSALPTEELKTKMKQMPVKVSYVLASRKAPEKMKFSIIDSYQGEKQREMLDRIEEHMPIQGDKRSLRTLGEKAVDDLERIIDTIMRRKKHIHDSEKARIDHALHMLEDLISESIDI